MLGTAALAGPVDVVLADNIPVDLDVLRKRVARRRRDVLLPENRLNRPQIRSAVEHVGSFAARAARFSLRARDFEPWPLTPAVQTLKRPHFEITERLQLARLRSLMRCVYPARRRLCLRRGSVTQVRCHSRISRPVKLVVFQ